MISRGDWAEDMQTVAAAVVVVSPRSTAPLHSAALRCAPLPLPSLACAASVSLCRPLQSHLHLDTGVFWSHQQQASELRGALHCTALRCGWMNFVLCVSPRSRVTKAETPRGSGAERRLVAGTVVRRKRTTQRTEARQEQHRTHARGGALCSSTTNERTMGRRGGLDGFCISRADTTATLRH